MRRRAFCRSVVAGTVVLAGCSSRPADQPGADQRPPETEPPTPTEDRSTVATTAPTAGPGRNLTVGLETEETDDAFVVTAVVENEGGSVADATLVAVWTLDERREERSRRVQLAPSETASYEFTFPEFGSISFEWRAPTTSVSHADGSRRAPRRSRR